MFVLFLASYISLLLDLGQRSYSFENKQDSIFVLFWNLENMFYYKAPSSLTLKPFDRRDSTFSYKGKKHWTKKRFYSKINLISKAILWIAEKNRRLPDIMGFCEIENKNVLNKLLYETVLRKTDYRIIHYESMDPRGIDVALLYRSDIFKYINSSTQHIVAKKENFPFLDKDSLLKTRDILFVKLELKKDSLKRKLYLAVNHHPSKYGGRASDWKRKAAVLSLRALVDSIKRVAEYNSIFVAMGDFNDSPNNEIFKILTDSNNISLYNYASDLYNKGKGSIRFLGKWDLIDMFFVGKFDGKSFDKNLAKMKIEKIPFLMQWDNVYSGFKPYRTYSGPKYIGGVSDHSPIILFIK